MKKILLALLFLPLSAFGMDEFNYWPDSPDMQSLPVFTNNKTKDGYAPKIRGHLASLYDNAYRLTKVKIALGSYIRRDFCAIYLRDVIEQATGNTLLHAAVRNRCPLNIVKALLEIGIDPSAKNNDQQTAFDIAQEKGFEYLLNMLFHQASPMEKPREKDGNDNNEVFDAPEDKENLSWITQQMNMRNALGLAALIGLFTAYRYYWQDQK